MYILCIDFLCILLFINNIITMLFIDVIVRVLYIIEMQFDFECVNFLWCLLHSFKMFELISPEDAIYISKTCRSFYM